MKRRRRADEPAHVDSLDHRAAGDGSEREHDVADPGRRPDEQALNAWLGRRLRRSLSSLSPLDRMIVVLREIEGLSTREVADLARVSEANVKTRLHRARAKLRAQLGDR
jgi:RNA polymerase sigma-70 factor (ECF subfamily)